MGGGKTSFRRKDAQSGDSSGMAADAELQTLMDLMSSQDQGQLPRHSAQDYFWEIQQANGTWTAMESADARILEKEYTKWCKDGKQSVKCKSSEFSWTSDWSLKEIDIDFVKMTTANWKGTEKCIRRRTPNSGADDLGSTEPHIISMPTDFGRAASSGTYRQNAPTSSASHNTRWLERHR